MSLPIDRTTLTAAQANQNPGFTASSAKNINALTALFDTVDELYNYLITALTSYYTKSVLDAGQLDNRYYTETEINGMLDAIKGLGYTDQTLKGLYDSVVAIQSSIDDLNTTYSTDAERIAAIADVINQFEIADDDLEVLINNKANSTEVYTRSDLNMGQLDTRYYTETEINALLDAIKGIGYTNQTLKDLYDAITSLQSNVNNLNTTYSTDAERIAAINDVISQFELADDDLTELINNKANTTDVYTKTQSDANYYNKTDVYTKSEVNASLATKTDLSGDHLGTWQGLTPSALGADGINASRIDALEEKVSTGTAPITTPLTHGTQVISTDQASDLDVVVYGNTRVNLLGEDGNFEVDSDGDGVADGWVNKNQGNYSLETSNVKHGSKAQRITALSGDTDNSVRHVSYPFNAKAGKYYIVSVDAVTDGVSDAQLQIWSDFVSYSVTSTTTSKNLYLKFSPSSNGIVNIYLYNYSALGSTGWVQFDGVRIYEIDQSTYNKIGVSLTDADVERMFPYVDSVQHVQNPVVKVEGENLIPPFTDSRWTLHANAEVISPYELELNATSAFSGSSITLPAISGQSYTLSETLDTGNYLGVVFKDANGVDLGSTQYAGLNTSGFKSLTVTAPSNTKKMTITASNNTTGTYTFKQPMLNLGSTAKPFTERNPSYLYAECTLAGNSDKKDILYHNDELNRWEKLKWWETDVVLDGSLSWAFIADYSGFKRVHAGTNFAQDAFKGQIPMVTKYNGMSFTRGTGDETLLSADKSYITSTPVVALSISDTDSGWTDAMTPTANMIKGYFNGWKYTGDGTNHSWVSIVDGTTTPATQTETFVADPVNMPSGYTTYKLTYQLAEPTVEPISVEGALSIPSGGAQITVGEGVIVREEVTPIDNGAGKYLINHTSRSGSLLDNKTKDIIAIYKNRIDDTNNWVIYNDVYAYGEVRADIPEEDIDPTASYTVTYLALDKYAMTANVVQVDATYATTLGRVVGQLVEDMSDVKSELSVQEFVNDWIEAKADNNAFDIETLGSGKLDATAYTASDVLTKIKTVDGAGSGLDADTLDGYEATSLMNATVMTIVLPDYCYFVTSPTATTDVKTDNNNGPTVNLSTKMISWYSGFSAGRSVYLEITGELTNAAETGYVQLLSNYSTVIATASITSSSFSWQVSRVSVDMSGVADNTPLSIKVYTTADWEVSSDYFILYAARLIII